MATSPYSSIGPDDSRRLKVEKIHPKVEFALETFPVNDAPQYEVLSYAWGTLPALEECICNCDGFYVSPTLYRGLQCIYRAVSQAGYGSTLFVSIKRMRLRKPRRL